MDQSKPKPKNLLDLMTPEDRAKVEQMAKTRQSQAPPSVSREWSQLAELGLLFGWPAIQAYLDDVITDAQANELILAARYIQAGMVYDQAIAVLAGSRGNFEALMKPYLSKAGAVD
jgi:ABC-type Fe3+ transport system substrate-binding protein